MYKANLDEISINAKRLEKNLKDLSEFGKDESGGINRSLGSKADIESRAWIKKYWNQKLNLDTHNDPIANIWGANKLDSDEILPIVIGSHNDSVPEGGMYDGALGVLMATEVLQTIQECKIKTRHPIQLISLTGEEPNPYQLSTVGSKALTGILTQDGIKKYKHIETGEPLSDAINRLGGAADQIDRMKLQKGQLAAFLECHIEQGRRLIDQNKPTAIVKDITGIYRELVTIKGESNHAGTTIISDRKDALLAASTIDLQLRKIIQDKKDDALVGTIGYLTVFPNAANIIPGEVEFNIDIRSADREKTEDVVRRLDDVFNELVARGFIIHRSVILDQDPVKMDTKVISKFDQIMNRQLGESINLTSMAGHDAANLARVTRAGMIFVASVDGKSHCKEEYSTIEDIEVTANVLLKTVLDLDKELD